MSKILKNNTGSPVNIADVGQTVPASGQLVIAVTDYLLYAASSDVITFIGDSTLTVNDGSSDLSISDGTDLIKGLFPKELGVLAGDDYTPIGHVGDRLKVDASISPFNNSNFSVFSTKLSNAGSVDMAVNGSVTPVVFSAGPTVTNEVWYLSTLSFALADSGNIGYSDFGAIANGLTNGVLVSFDIGGSTYNSALFKHNYELVTGFNDAFRGQANSFINDVGFVTALVRLQYPIILRQADSDKFNLTVQDNLTGLNLLEAVVSYYREV